ncbi:MAG: CocE/NonD family hydrolase [Gemmatimonadota bacterium]
MTRLSATRARALVLGLSALLCTTIAAAQAPTDWSVKVTRRDVMVPMRDGVKLHTEIYTPKGHPEAMPFIMTRTPYGLLFGTDAKGFPNGLANYRELIDDGFIIVLQDIRGKSRSEGRFVMLRPPRSSKDPKAIDESTDAYDTIDWLLTNVPNNNGRAGMMGISYMGWTTVMAMLDPHPALKAVSPQASPADMYIGDDFHHNGAFRLSYAMEYAFAMERGAEVTPFKFSNPDTYQWYLDLGPLVNVKENYGGAKLPTWVDFVSHPNYDAFWKRQAFAPYLTKVTVPTLNVAGWWDQEDFYGPLEIYRLLEQHDTKNQNFLVVGPWNHGGWGAGKGDSLGKVSFGSRTGEYFREKIQLPWFQYHLKGQGTLALAEATTFEPGANRWVSHTSWPERSGTSVKKLYLQPGGKLSWEPPAASGKAFAEYVSNPDDPVPYRKRPIDATLGFNGWPTWQVQDQRFLAGRKDVPTWISAPLESDVVIAGSIVAKLFASTSGTDSDWIVKLIDAYPEPNTASPPMAGYQLMVMGDVLRGRFRQSFERPAALKPNVVTPYQLDLHSVDYRFLKGHRIMVQIQSSWFPIIDRNPQTFTPSIFEAKRTDYRSATQRVYHSPAYPTHLEMVVGN